MLLTGAIGGLYSSTMTTLLLAKKSRHDEAGAEGAAAAILLSTPTMYLRILFLVFAFKPVAALRLFPPFLVLSVLAGGYAWWLKGRGASESEVAPEEVHERNPLELSSAFLFALMFVTVAVATRFVLLHFHDLGLRMLSFLVGASDIVPFIISVLQGNLGIVEANALQAVVIATASNNLMKAVYTFAFGHRRTARPVAAAMTVLAALSFVYVAVAL
jgi:uncharacterized membrane protein (DUF4010 family)